MEGQLAVHLPGTDPEEPAKLTDREILNMNKKKKKKKNPSKKKQNIRLLYTRRFFKNQLRIAGLAEGCALIGTISKDVELSSQLPILILG